MLMINSKD